MNCCSNLVHVQESGGWGTSASASDSVSPLVTCSSNAGGSFADPTTDNPSYSIFFPENNTYSPALTLTILLEAWPISLYPFVNVLPSGSTLVIAGRDTADGLCLLLPVDIAS